MKKYFWWPLAAISFVGVLVFFIIAIATMMMTYTVHGIWWKLFAASMIANFLAGLALMEPIEGDCGGTEGWY